MSITEKRLQLKRAVMDVFLFWGKTEQERYNALSTVCELVGKDPSSDADRSRMLGEIMACRAGSYEREMPKIQLLVRRYVPSAWDPILDFFR